MAPIIVALMTCQLVLVALVDRPEQNERIRPTTTLDSHTPKLTLSSCGVSVFFLLGPPVVGLPAASSDNTLRPPKSIEEVVIINHTILNHKKNNTYLL